MSANSHSGAELLNYPYDTEQAYPADAVWWEFVCWEYADTAHEYSPSGYLTDQGGGVTNGYAWYTATGTRQDYMNYYEHCREVTLELSAAKLLDAEDLPDYWEYNRRSLLNYMEQVTYGLRGIVTDSITHEPLEAIVAIEVFDFFNSHVYSFPTYGDYYRLLEENASIVTSNGEQKNGTYYVTFSCEGYRSKTFGVEIENYQQTIQDVELVNLNNLPPLVNFVSNVQEVECNNEISFINTSEASESTTYLWDFGDGTSSTEENPTHRYNQNGTFSVKLYGENEYGIDSLWQMYYIDVSLTELNDISDYAICESAGSVTIDPDLTGEVHWFEDINDETSFHVGATYTTPTLSENTTYFVQEITLGDEYSGGEVDNSEGGDYVSDNNYLIFDCTQESVLKTVKVYAENAGTRTIYLKTSGGVEIYSEDVYIEAGEQVVTLNLNLPVGEDMRLGCANPNGLYRGSTGVWSTFPYPYDIGGIVTISESNVVWWNDGDRYYAYFYDWDIKLQDCYSERTPISVYLNETPQAGFESSSEGTTVEFINTSTASETFVWDFGDENLSTQVNPTHVYSEPGTYTVILTATSECGSDISTQEVLVTAGIYDEVNNEFSIYPNPVYDVLTISSEEQIDQIRIIDITGRTIEINAPVRISNREYRLDARGLMSGSYVLEIKTKTDIKVTKIIKN
ncbi:MAG: hypothetical protein C0596_10215 [Marinilabiliales bacterium]|nr:MAG: hypothetical protein C0596_10215 [Marinilabiliales bacterium]